MSKTKALDATHKKLDAANAEVKFLLRRLAFIKKYVRLRSITAHLGSGRATPAVAYYESAADRELFRQLFDLAVLFEEEK